MSQINQLLILTTYFTRFNKKCSFTGALTIWRRLNTSSLPLFSGFNLKYQIKKNLLELVDKFANVLYLISYLSRITLCH